MKYGIIFLIISAVTPIIMAKLMMPKHDENKEILRYPSHCIFFGVTGNVFIALATILAIMDDHNIKTIYMFIMVISIMPLYLGTIYLILLGTVWKFEVYDTYFVFRNVFGKKKRYEYSQITKVTKITNRHGKVEKIKLVLDTRTITITYMVVNFKTFENTLKKHFRKNNCKIIFNSAHALL